MYEIFKHTEAPARAKLLNESEESGIGRGSASGFIRSGAHTPLTSYGLYGTGLSDSSLGGSKTSLGSSFTSLSPGVNNSAPKTEIVRQQCAGAGDSRDFSIKQKPTVRKIEKDPNACWAMLIMEDIIHNGHPITKESNNPDQGNKPTLFFTVESYIILIRELLKVLIVFIHFLNPFSNG